ncbi:hypothetical protein BC828DRAFT_410178 [Blastocladiella britannica]|nr:hypothetical protein BC828DRAFT_410178 [Blastocladiella britannica]
MEAPVFFQLEIRTQEAADIRGSACIECVSRVLVPLYCEASRPYFATNGSSDSDGGESTGDESDNDRQDGENEEDEDEEESGHVAFTLGLETMHGQARDHSEPKKAADEAENAVARVPQASMCAICLEDLIADDDPAAALSCGHVYHTTY